MLRAATIPVALVGLTAFALGDCGSAREASTPAGVAGAATSTRIAGGPTSARVCDRVAAPSGSDRARGTAARPWRSVGRLVAGLAAGQTGCLRAGTYREDLTIRRSGITLRSQPGGRATLIGRLWVQREAHDVVVSDLALDGRNARRLPSPTVNGRDVTFARVDVTNRRSAICFLLGSDHYGRARGTTIERSRIHGCGVLPSTNLQHGIYVDLADDTRILDDVIYDNADRGVQLYPDAQRTVVRGNVIDGNGEGVLFSGDGARTSDGNVVEGNVIAHSRLRADVESYYPPGAPAGSDNVVRGNCVGRVDASAGGFTTADDVRGEATYRDRAAGDFRLRPGSRCAAVLAASRAPAGPDGQRPLPAGARTTP